jgi:hypothetical protein
MRSPPESQETAWSPAPPRWGWADALALAVWTAALVVFFWDAATLRRALFYFDITEINYPYRHFFATELKAGRLSFWGPGLYCGHPLYSESQTGYFHPFKYLFYPWLAPWRAFNLDTLFSVWLTGAATYGWLRRHVGPAGALTGAAVLGLSGYTWAHFVHTSMINALPSVPLAFWALEVAWDRRSLRAVALGALALACQVFAGHLQDTILTGSALGVYGLYRAAIERGAGRRAWAIGAVVLMGVLAVLVSAVQWVPSKELIDRSPRAGGLSWDRLTYGSWHPELLPTLLVREAYGTRARDTDWMDGFYPYHEMDAYLGVVGLGLAVVGMSAYRDRWVAGWLILGALGLLLMLGRFTFLMDVFPRIPLVGSGRVPVRYHLWVAVATAALAAVGVDRLARAECGRVRLREALLTLGWLVALSIPILFYVYQPFWIEARRWPLKYHADRRAWLSAELAWASVRTLALALGAYFVASRAARAVEGRRWAALLPLLVLADLLGAHAGDVPTIDPRYWTEPPASARWLLRQPDVVRIFGEPTRSSGEPGHAVQAVDFEAVRNLLAWSLPTVWGLRSTAGETPIIPARRLRFTEAAQAPWRYQVEGLSHVITSTRDAEARLGPAVAVGPVTIHRNPYTLPRARLVGRPIYAAGVDDAAAALATLGASMRDRIVVEDPGRPLAAGAEARGTAEITREVPDRVEVAVRARTPAYLLLADTFDPGWSATLDGQSVPVHPADVMFRAVFVPEGSHTVVFRYRPAGFDRGLVGTLVGLALIVTCLVVPWRAPALGPSSGPLDWPRTWPRRLVMGMLAVVLLSIVGIGPGGRPRIQGRWTGSWHRFTWGAGIEAMHWPGAPQPSTVGSRAIEDPLRRLGRGHVQADDHDERQQEPRGQRREAERPGDRRVG